MAQSQDIRGEFFGGPDIYESLDESKCGPEIYEPSTEEQSELSDGENAASQNPYDVTFIVGNHETKIFSLNRVVCEISSPEFRRILQEQPKRRNCYEIQDVSPEDFDVLVDYMFLKSPWTFSNFPTALSHVKIAEKFQFFALQEEIFAQLRIIMEKEFPDDELVFQAYSAFKKFDIRHDGLTKAVQQRIFKNADKLFQRDEFLQLSLVDFRDILASDDLGAESELQVVKAVIRWGIQKIKDQEIPFKMENLWKALAPLMDYVRFGNLSETQFRQYIFPLNILPAKKASDLRIVIENHSDKLRNYLEHHEPAPILWGTADGTELEIVQAELFISTVQHEMLLHNERMEHKNRQSKLQFYLRQSKKTNERLKSDFEIAESTHQKSQELIKFQEIEVKTLKETITGLQAELLKIKNEQLLSRMYLNRKASRTLTFENAQNFAIAFIIENATITTLNLHENYMRQHSSLNYGRLMNGNHVEYEKVTKEIPPQTTKGFGLTDHYASSGFISYQIYDVLLYVKYDVRNNLNRLVMAVSPLMDAHGENMYKMLNPTEDWLDLKDRILEETKITDWTKNKEEIVSIKLGKLKISAIMKTGAKAVVMIKIHEE